jgi:hypothetical protein
MRSPNPKRFLSKEYYMRTVVSPIRKCGLRKQGGVYAVGGEEGSEEGVLDRFVLISPPIPYQVSVHRSARIVDAHTVLSRSPMDDWWYGSSKETEISKSGSLWSMNIFGMTTAKRLSIGECEGLDDPETALATLAGKIRYNARIVDYFRDMTVADVHLDHKVTVHYEKLHEHLHSYVHTQEIGDLMGAQAAIWRMAFNIPPRKRRVGIPYLMRLLVLMNLTKDATAMTTLFLKE